MVAEGVFATGALASYCGVADVLALLSAHDASAWGGQEALAGRIRALLAPTRGAVDGAAGRDFLHHPDSRIVMDGSGGPRLLLSPVGIHPPVAVHQVHVDGTQLPPAWWRYDAVRNCVRLRASARLQRFPTGVQNVTVQADFGYPHPPGQVALAQASLVAARLLSELGGAEGAVQALSLGDYTVRYGTSGRWGVQIEGLMQSARDALSAYRPMGIRSV